MNKERLRELLKSNLKIIPKKFNQDSWCGTSACQIGWFVYHKPELKKLLSNPSVTVKFIGSFAKIASYFGIAHAEAEDMFSTACYENSSGKDYIKLKSVEEELLAHNVRLALLIRQGVVNAWVTTIETIRTDNDKWQKFVQEVANA